MNTGTLVLGIVAVLAIGGVAIAATREEEEPEPTGPELPPINTIPPGALPPIGNPPTYQWPPIPPSDFPIVGGQYVDSINKWCPPGYLYNGNSGMCEALQTPITIDPNIFQQVNLTQGNGDVPCCESCAIGGACTGCS